ncbi:MAG: hypothetical protein QXI07_07590 [Pyrobaculum sp.]
MTRPVLLGVLLALFVALAFLSARQEEASVYLVDGFIPPFAEKNITAALGEAKNYSLWASWYGQVSIFVGSTREELPKLAERGYESKVYDVRTGELKYELKFYKRGDKYVIEVREGPRRILVNDTDLEEALWKALAEARSLSELPNMLAIWLMKYKFDLPWTSYGAFAIPFCNGSYYGPFPPPLKVGESYFRIQFFVENRTIKPFALPTYREVEAKWAGRDWFGNIAVDACALGYPVAKSGVVAIVDKNNVAKVVEILKSYGAQVSAYPIK